MGHVNGGLPDAILINGWDWLLQKATSSLNYWLKKLRKKWKKVKSKS